MTSLREPALRWVARLERMPLLERQALLSAIASIGEYGVDRGSSE